MIEKIYLHPDALYEEPYVEHSLNTDDFGINPDTEKVSLGKGKFNLSGKGAVLAEVVNKNVIRIRISAKNNLFSPSITEQTGLVDVDYTYKGEASENGSVYTLKTDNLSLAYNKDSGEISFCDADGNLLVRSANGPKFGDKPEYSGENSLCYFDIGEDEHFFGFGARIMHPDRTGTTVDIFTEKVGRLSGDYGGCPVPFYMSTKGYGLFFNNPWPHLYFDMGKSHEDKWFVHAPGGSFDIFVIKGEDMPEILKEFTALTGRVAIPRRWNLGFWCSSIQFVYGEEVKGYALRMHEEGYPCDAMVMDGTWRAGKQFLESYGASNSYESGDFDWHPDFGDGKKLVEDLKKENMKLVLHLNSRSFKESTYTPALEKGLLRQHGEEVVPMLLDKEGENFYKDMLRPRVQDGVSEFWTDHADRVSGELKPGIPSRNLFGSLWNKLLAELMAENGVENHMSLTRGGGIGGQRYSLPWAGDTRFGIDYLVEDIRYMLNGSISGYSLIGYDLGGFMSLVHGQTPEEEAEQAFEPENVCRRICHAILYTPIPRVHSGQAAPKLPWNLPEATRPLLKECLRKRYSWIPYVFSYAVQSSRNGRPIVCPLVYKHMDDKNVYSIDDEFYMGDTLLFAPAVEKGSLEREVYLPEGRWVEIWTGECFDGNQTITRQTPVYSMEGVPVFAKGGHAMVSIEPELTVKEEIPEKIKIEFYGTESELSLWEGNNTCNTFRFADNTVYLENNTTEKRTYEVVVYDISGDKAKVVFEKTYEAQPLSYINEVL